MGKETQNYLDGLPDFSARVAAFVAFGGACLRRLRWKLGSREMRPDYVAPEHLRAALEAKLDQAPCRILACPESVGQARFDAGTRSFLERYRGLFEQFLAGADPRNPDPEVAWTLHQFGWLVGLALDSDGRASREFATRSVLAWIERFPTPSGHPAWRAFSVSERLVSWTALMELGLLPADDARVRASMLVQAVHLAGRLENLSDGGTNNHLLNNGRALLVAGKVLGAGALSSLGRTILLEEAGRQFTKSGFLDEGSSHYQLVFTRAYLDALRFDPSLIIPLGGLVSRMKAACRFLRDCDASDRLVMPFFGDISPDPPPGLFYPRARFWDAADRWDRPWYEPGEAPLLPHPAGWASLEEAGLYRWRADGMTLWWHARRGGLRRLHAHNDWGGFQLHAAGRPVLVDLGRPTYAQREGEFDFRATLAHNTLRVDGFEQALFSKRDAYRDAYHSEGAAVGLEEGSLRMELSCFHRLCPPTSWTRTFRPNPNAVAIRDRLSCARPRSLELAFHAVPDVMVDAEGNEVLLDRTFRLRPAPGGVLRVVKGPSAAEAGGWCSGAYGERRATHSVFVSYPPRAEFDLIHSIERL